MKIKDVYYLGVSILEFMVVKTSRDKFSISLDSLPVTWAKAPESGCLIQILSICLSLEVKSESDKKLTEIFDLIQRDYQRYF